MDEEQVVHSKSDNKEVMTYDNENKVIKEILESLLSRNQIGLETSMKGSNLILIRFSRCLTNATRKILDVLDHI